MSEVALTGRPRYSTESLPPYSYVPGFWPHPVSDPRGHMHGHQAMTPAALIPEQWQESSAYRYGVDLFNHGFYWEAHEAWESLWHAAGRRGPVATWLKALIKLAAAAVKMREGNAAGTARHSQRCLQLVDELRIADSPDQAWSGLVVGADDDLHYCGVDLHRLRIIAKEVGAEAEGGLVSPDPTRLLKQWIRLAF